MTRAVVTGGAGFLGSHLCDSLLADGYEVICLDNLQTGSLDNIEYLRDHKNFKFYFHNVQYPVIKYDADEYWNMASPASPKLYQIDPVDTFMTNVMGVKNILDACRVYDAKMLQSSTSEVYGDPDFSPQPESYRGNVNPIGPRACYDEGKRGGETLMSDYNRMYKTKIRIARIFNTYGPRLGEGDGRVISNFIVQALKNKPITIYGNGMQTRSFCYVDDMIMGFRALMDSDVIFPVNLGNPDEFTIHSLAELVKELTGSSSKIIYESLPVDDPLQRKPDITRAGELLGWEPKIKLREGLLKTIEYFEKNLLLA